DAVRFVGSGHYLASTQQDKSCGPASVALWDAKTASRRDVPIPREACAGGLESIDLSWNDQTLVVGWTGQSAGATGGSQPPPTVARVDVGSPAPRVLSVDSVDLEPHAVTAGRDGETVVIAEEDRARGGFQ